MSKKTKVIQTSGSRKTAVARLAMVPGNGKITVNGISLENIKPAMVRMKIEEVCLFGESILSSNDLKISVNGGGVISQADAVRLAIGKAFVAKNEKLRENILSYDRQMLVGDTRFKEAAKPNCQGSARSKRQKSYR